MYQMIYQTMKTRKNNQLLMMKLKFKRSKKLTLKTDKLHKPKNPIISQIMKKEEMWKRSNQCKRKRTWISNVHVSNIGRGREEFAGLQIVIRREAGAIEDKEDCNVVTNYASNNIIIFRHSSNRIQTTGGYLARQSDPNILFNYAALV